MGNEESDLRDTAKSKRKLAKDLQREAQLLERRADALTSPRVMFEVAQGRTLSVTQAQLHFIHTKAFGLEAGAVHVVRFVGEKLTVTAGDERWVIDELAEVHSTEGFDPFDKDWVTK